MKAPKLPMRCEKCRELYFYDAPEGEEDICPRCGHQSAFDLSLERDRIEWEYGYEGRCGGCNRVRTEEHSIKCDMRICSTCHQRAITCPCNVKIQPQPEAPSDLKLHEIVKNIVENRSKILDDFCKAYLAENMQDIPIKDLTLIEQQVPSKEKFGGMGYKYWFEQKPEVEWISFEKKWPNCDWLWVSDFKTVWLSDRNTTSRHSSETVKNYFWAKATIPAPDLPVRPAHLCYSGPLCQSCCVSDENGRLILKSGQNSQVFVEFCPFCGIKGENDGK